MSKQQRTVRALTGGLYEYIKLLISREIVSRPVGKRIMTNLDSIEDKYEMTQRLWKRKSAESSKECDELKARIVELHATCFALPKDKSGRVLRIGDAVCIYGDYKNPRRIAGIGPSVVFFQDGSCARVDECTYWESPHDRAEQIIRELTLGNLTEAEAIDVIAELLEVE